MDDIARAWFERRTFPADAWTLGELRRAKGDTRVSVIIPARNESATIGEIVALIHASHVQGSGLVDELIVIDSDSTDDTAQVAAVSGATVHSAADIRPDLGWRPGKGEAMWKSLLVSTGDLVVFIDGDLSGFTPEYVSGLLGPLLLVPGVDLVKAFYDRDLAGASIGVAQGGRVTELTARPLITLWWPELAGIVQPLAGEWAARRSLLESLPFPSGYGVELGVLVDTCARQGIDAIAQVDLGVRAHAHQDLVSLGAVAAEVMAAAMLRRFGEEADQGSEIVHPRRASSDSAQEWIARPLHCSERPTIASVLAQDATVSVPGGRP